MRLKLARLKRPAIRKMIIWNARIGKAAKPDSSIGAKIAAGEGAGV